MEKKQIKINGKITVEIKINGGLFWKAGGPGPTEPNKLVYSANAAGSTITVNGETVTLEQGDNIELNYANEITSVKATRNTALTAIQIPNTVTEIGANAFKDCKYLAYVNIPDSVKSIGNSAFMGCNKLASITIPDGVTMIGASSFKNCTELASITIPESVTSIKPHQFNGCNKLVSITISSGVKSIEYRAFYNCTALTDFNFNGTKAQWASITKGDEWNLNAAFTVVHCTDGDVNIL